MAEEDLIFGKNTVKFAEFSSQISDLVESGGIENDI